MQDGAFTQIRRKVSMRLRLFEIHEQPWFPQFLRDQFVDGLQMILEVTKTYQPIAQLLKERLEECGSERVLDLCSGAGGPWPSLVRDFQMQGAKSPEVFLTDKFPSTTKLHELGVHHCESHSFPSRLGGCNSDTGTPQRVEDALFFFPPSEPRRGATPFAGQC